MTSNRDYKKKRISPLVLSKNMKTIVLFPLWFLLCFQACLAADFLKVGQQITRNSSDVLVSSGKRFSLGFFSSSYLGIWYYQSQNSEMKTVVWVANRDNPVMDSYGVFQIADDGNLVVTNASGGIYWSSNLKRSSSKNRTVKLMDSGNLVLIDGLNNGMSYVWQSFQHPTDRFLPGMKMDTNLELIAWRDEKNPGSGNYTFKMSPTGDKPYIILQKNKTYWDSGENGELNSGSLFYAIAYMLSNFSMSTTDPRYQTGNTTFNPKGFENTTLLMNSTGQLQFLTRDGFQGGWSVRWMAPENFCDSHNPCGNFSSCNTDYSYGRSCPCLPGFSRSDRGVCARKSASSCSSEGTKFLTLAKVKLGRPPKKYAAANEAECKIVCLHMCPACQAYSYAEPINTFRSSDNPCWVWDRELNTIQQGGNDNNNGRTLNVRVDISDIAPTPKTCEPCGTKVVPYPLSTRPGCGDPMYFKFSCNPTTGQLIFNTSGDTHTVISMDEGSRKFTIKVDFLSTCGGEQSQNEKTLQVSLPFSETDNCLGKDQVEITWQPPPEPVCNESPDCEGWSHSSCKEAGDEKRCLCDTNYRWDNVSLICTNIEGTESKTSEGNSRSHTYLILGITLAGAVILACAIIFAYVCRRKITRKDKESIQRKRGRFYDSERHVKDLIEDEGLEEKDTEGIDVPYFDFESILVATDNFSDANKLGRGGYGPVYKAEFQDGEIIAVKRLSNVSSQGLQEFKNEVVLIAKLQHRNLVRLRGYCIKGQEKILLYEYMHNKSLDTFIFDPTKSVLLDWQLRFDIILGVARGLLYLHQDSRLRVIHRDMKTSNILLDEEMQPKISDFGLARIVGGKETEANTERVVGTYGYMSPEYALDGFFSVKSDVFSFGVIILEIISGKKNTGFYQSNQVSSILGYAWRLWTENKLADLMDMTVRDSCNANQFIRCAHIGLLCVQDEPSDRPNMSNVVTMLDSETSTLPIPKQPTFFASRGLYSTSSSSKPETSMQFESSTKVEGR